MEGIEGSFKKRRKNMANDAHDDNVLLSQVKSENVTLQPSAVNALEHDSTAVQIPDSASFKLLSVRDSIRVQNQVECSSAPKGPLQVPDAEVMVNNGAQGAESSSKDPALINVEGYCVKKEVAPMLRRIFDKYKDIARDCKINDRTILVPILEMICSFCQKLEDLSLSIVVTELEDMISIVENFWLMGFDVKWLSERLKQLLKDSLALQEDITKIKIKEEDVGILKQKLSTAEAELEIMKVENDKARRKFEQQRMDLNMDGFLPNSNPTEGRAAKVAQAKAKREKRARALTETVESNPPTLHVQQSSLIGADEMITTADMNSTDVRKYKFARTSRPSYFDALERRAANYAQAKAEREKSARALTETVEVNPPTLPVQQRSSNGADRTTTADMEREGRAMPIHEWCSFDALERRGAICLPKFKAEREKRVRALTETVEVNRPGFPVHQSSSCRANTVTTESKGY